MQRVSRNIRLYIKRWLTAFAWAGLIFAFSTEAFSGGNTKAVFETLIRHLFPAWSGDAVELAHLWIRKFGHFGEYFVLAVLVLRALREETEDLLPFWRVALGLAITALYAVSDEWHQALVPGRSASIADVALDIFGGSCGILWLRWRSRYKIPRSERPPGS